jgi:hypothetical protein
MARISLVREADCKPAVLGSIPRRVSTARRPRDKDNDLLNRECAFDSRRADGGAHAIGTTEFLHLPVRIWLVLRFGTNQSEKLSCGFNSRFQLEPLISGGVTVLGRAWCAGEGYFGY